MELKIGTHKVLCVLAALMVMAACSNIDDFVAEADIQHPAHFHHYP